MTRLLLPLLAFFVLKAAAQQTEYGQCGGIGWTGATTCVSPYACTYENDYYSQCLAATSSTTTTKTSTTSTKTSSTSSTKSTTTKTSSSSSTKSTTSTTSTSKTTTTKTSTKTTTTTVGPGTTCTVTAYASVSSATKSCTNILLSNVAVPSSTTLNLSKLSSGTTLTFGGTTTFAYGDFDGDLIEIGGEDITVTAEPGAIIDGNGSAWWDGQGSNGGITKPDHFIVLKTTGTSVVENLHIRNWPVHCFEITSASGTTIQNLVLDNSAGDAPNSRSGGLAAAHNSDGFDISSSTNIVLNNITVYNQDDCVAVTSGDTITVSNMYCSGGHGLSIGSIGGKSNNDVSNVIFKDSTIINSQNGCRIKTNSGTTGSVKDITYSNIKLSGITVYGIDVQQDYLNGGPTGTPTNGVTIDGLTITDVTGTATSSAYDVYLLCGSGSCSDFTFTGVSITGGKGNSCNYAPSGYTC